MMPITTQPICTNCGQPHATIKARPSGSAECDPCYRAGLAHGHLHVDHDPYDADLRECPLCAGERDEDQRISQVLDVPISAARRMGR